MALLAIILVLVTVGLSQQTPITVGERTVANANNDFTTKFSQYLKEASPKENAVFSPVSASSVLAGLAQGAAGTTRSQLLTALSLTDNDQLIRSGYRSIITSYNTSLNANVTLNMADAFFVGEKFTPKASFVSMMRSDFKSEVQTLDFADSTAVDKINSWVSQRTNGLIDKLFSSGELPPTTLMVLTNAVYFKGSWKESFNKKYTLKQTFHLSSTETADVDMMTLTSKFVVYSDDSLQAEVLEIPYSGDSMKMVIVLPYETDGLEKTIKNLRHVPKPSPFDVAEKYNIYVPRFKITASIDVGEMLQSLGVTEAFSRSADFSRLSDSQLVVSSVKQKAFVEVNEEGTSAAAATGVPIGGWYPGMPTTPDFKVDHPFLYFIVHVPTETAVFAGHILKP